MHGYVPMNKQKVEIALAAVNTRNNGMLHFRLYIGNIGSTMLQWMMSVKKRSKSLKKKNGFKFHLRTFFEFKATRCKFQVLLKRIE